MSNKLSNESVLQVEKVRTIFLDCMWKTNENMTDLVKVEGIESKVMFSKQRLGEHKEEIVNMLNELPDEFKEGSGGGWTFLNACVDKHGNQWTGQHDIMEQLFLLGLAIGKVIYLLPRELWSVLPGGMPYYCILNQPEQS